MGLKDEFADALDAIRDFNFHATNVSEGIYLVIVLCLWECHHGVFLRTLWVQLTIPLWMAAGNSVDNEIRSLTYDFFNSLDNLRAFSKS